MALTEQQKRLRALVFPGKRGKLDKHDQKIFAQMCAERGFPLDEATKPTSTRKAARRTSFKDDTSEEEPDIDDVDDEAELEEVVQEEQQEHEPPAGTREIKTEVNAASDVEDFSDRGGAAPTASAGPAPVAKQRRRRTGRKGGRPSAVDTAAQALIGLTSSKSPLPAAAAAGRQRIAAVLPGAGFKPFAGVAMALGSRQGSGAGQRSDAPYDYYEVYGSYLNCMELYSKAAGRLGADAVAAPIPPEELLGPAYASHLSTDPSAPHWTPPAAALDADAAAAQAANAKSDRAARAAARAAAAGNPDKQLAADTGPAAAAAASAGGVGRGKRKMSAGVGDAVQAAAKRPYHRRSAAHKADADAAAAASGDADQEDVDLADDQQHTTAAAAEGTAPQGAAAAAVLCDRLDHRMNGTGSRGSQEHDARSGSTVPVAVAANGNGTAAGGSSDVEMAPPPPAAAAVGLQSKDAGAAVVFDDGDDEGSQLDGLDDISDVSDDSDSSGDSESDEDGGGQDTGDGSPATGDAPQQLQQDQRQEQAAQQQKAPLRPALQELLTLQAQQPIPALPSLVDDAI